MRVHELLIFEIVDVDSLFEALMLLVQLDQVLKNRVHALSGGLIITNQMLGHDLECLFLG